jgi:hypothetical protein
MEEFDFQANWCDMATPPPSGTRCIVTDGEVIFIATYILETDGNNMWICSGLAETDSKNFKVQGWMPLPKPILKPIEKIVKENEKRNDS